MYTIYSVKHDLVLLVRLPGNPINPESDWALSLDSGVMALDERRPRSPGPRCPRRTSYSPT